MKVLFIKPSWPYPYTKDEYTYNRIWIPLELINCAAILRQHGVEADVLDAHARRTPPEQLPEHVRGFDKIFITSSSRDRWQCPNIDIEPFLSAVRTLSRETSQEIYILGYHGTVEPEKILKLCKIKAVVRGEPEETVLDICRNENFDGIPGLSFIKDGAMFHTPDRPPADIRKLPVPAFDLINFDQYSYEILGDRFAIFEINRGCEYKCTFCNQSMYGKKVRTKTIEQVKKELQTAIEKHDVRSACFMDLHFLTNKHIVLEMCDFLITKNYKFKWACSTRSDSLDEHILKKMKAAGCRLVKMGVETGQQVLLDDVRKLLELSHVHRAFKLCRRLGIKTLAFFMFGIPGETDEDRRLNLEFSKALNPDFVSFHKLVPYKGAPIAKNGYKKPQKDFSKIIRNAYMQFYLRPSYLLNLSPSVALASFKLFKGRVNTLSR